MPEALTLHEAFAGAAGALRQAGVETPELDARLLLCHAAALTHEAYIAQCRETLPAEAGTRLEAALARRLKREPVSRILGKREFYGREFLVGAHTLDPRPDTETLVAAALSLTDAQNGRSRPLSLLDLGTGTGCILLTLLAELPRAEGLGTDLNKAALRLAAANAERLGLAARASFRLSDWFEWLREDSIVASAGSKSGVEGFDLIVANPPYLATAEIAALAEEVRLYDPPLALDGGADGLQAYRRIAAGAPLALAGQGRLLLEIGPAQGTAVAEILGRAGLTVEAIKPDLAGRPRVVVARR
jgi:release factor glutamine methyltransferase